MRLLIRAPDHLGDGVMALPAVAGLARLGDATLVGPRWAPELYAGLGLHFEHEVPRAGAGFDLAALLKPSFRAAWEARRARRRVGLSTDGRRLLLSDPVAPGEGHRVEDLRAVARAAGAEASGQPCFAPAPVPCPALPARAVLLLPGTRSGPPVAWQGFRALADRLEGRAIFAGGPDEQEAVAALAGPHPRLTETGLAAFAAAAVAAEAVVGNDSGLPHLAAAARRGAGGRVSAVHVVYGSTDPARTGPPGSTAHPGPRPPCWPCYRKSCDIGVPCLAVSPEALLAALR